MVLLKRIYDLELKIDQFLNLISESSILFEQFVKQFLNDKKDECQLKVKLIREKERLADDLRIHIEKYVYTKLLIPENRGDVLSILENTDDVIDKIKQVIIEMEIESPHIPEFLNESLINLATAVANCVDELIKAVRAFFYNVHDVPNNVHKVLFFEKEADTIAERMRYELYKSDISLAEKNHLKYFILGIEEISNLAQAVADRLTIYTIKRKL
jgi:hypothetical protein